MVGEYLAALASFDRVRYRHIGMVGPWDGRGIDPEHGTDCINFVVRPLQMIGLYRDLPSFLYPRKPDGRLPKLVGRFCRRIGIGQADVGDLLMFADSDRPPRACHIAAVVGTSPRIEIMHSSLESRRVVRQGIERFTYGAPVGCWRIPELDRG